MNHYAECKECGNEVTGRTFYEALEDAYRIGWEHVSGRLLCAGCLSEMEKAR